MFVVCWISICQFSHFAGEAARASLTQPTLLRILSPSLRHFIMVSTVLQRFKLVQLEGIGDSDLWPFRSFFSLLPPLPAYQAPSPRAGTGADCVCLCVLRGC
jgi:hypothetical protein